MSDDHIYRIRGAGDVREVYDGRRLVGVIKRKSREVMSWRIGPTSATGRKVTETWWIATRASGAPVRWHDGRRLCRDRLKDWADPKNWTGAHVEPEEVPDVG